MSRRLRQSRPRTNKDADSLGGHIAGASWNDCDKAYNQSVLYADWLREDEDNQLTILAGELTEDERNLTYADGTAYAHAGIQNVLFTEIRGTELAEQVTVCNYNDVFHDRMYEEFSRYLAEPPIKSPEACPENTVNDSGVYGWRP